VYVSPAVVAKLQRPSTCAAATALPAESATVTVAFELWLDGSSSDTMPPISLSIVTGPSSLPVVADHAAETTNAPLPRSRVNCRSEAAAQKHREPKKRAPDPKLHPDKPANVREWLEGRMSGIYGHEQVKEKFRTLFKVMQLEKHKRSDHTSLNSTQVCAEIVRALRCVPTGRADLAIRSDSIKNSY
jgi:hypothetical protein